MRSNGKIRPGLWAAGLSAACMLFAPSASAQLGGRAFAAGGLGLASANHDVGTGVGFGMEGGYYFRDPFGVGVLFRSGSHENGITSLLFGIEGLCRLDPWIPGISFGLDAATIRFSGGDLGGDYHFGAGGKIAYDYSFNEVSPVTVGAEVGLNFTKPAGNMLTVFTVMATAKFWL